MLIGYARISKADDSQVLDLQIDALIEAGVNKENIYTGELPFGYRAKGFLTSNF